MVRLQPEQLSRLDAWISDHPDQPSRPAAIRQLIDRGLVGEPSSSRSRRTKGAPKAAEMAGREIDRHGGSGPQPARNAPAGNEDCSRVRKSSATYGGNDQPPRNGAEASSVAKA